MKNLEFKLEVNTFEEIISEVDKVIDKCENAFIKVENSTNVELYGVTECLDENLKIYWNVDFQKENILYISKRYRNFKEELEQKKNEWFEISELERYCDFLAKFMKETGVEDKSIICSMIYNFEYKWIEDFEFSFTKFEVIKEADTFASILNLNNSRMKHSWAGGSSNIDKAWLLYGHDNVFKFGENSSYQYFDNGNQTDDDNTLSSCNFDINSTYIVMIRNHDYSNYNNEYYDYISYSCYIYKGSDYKSEYEDIFQKYISEHIKKKELVNIEIEKYIAENGNIKKSDIENITNLVINQLKKR